MVVVIDGDIVLEPNAADDESQKTKQMALDLAR